MSFEGSLPLYLSMWPDMSQWDYTSKVWRPIYWPPVIWWLLSDLHHSLDIFLQSRDQLEISWVSADQSVQSLQNNCWLLSSYFILWLPPAGRVFVSDIMQFEVQSGLCLARRLFSASRLYLYFLVRDLAPGTWHLEARSYDLVPRT